MDRELTVGNPNPLERNLKTPLGISYTYLASAFILAVCTLYLWGYWGHFNINILEFVGVSDIVRVAAYPLVGSVFFILAGGLIGAWMPTDFMGARNTPGASKKARTIFLWVTLALPFFVLIFWDLLPNTKWVLAPIALAPLISMWICLKTNVHQWFGVSRINAFPMVLLVIGVAWGSFGLGRDRAIKVTSGKEFSYFANIPLEPSHKLPEKMRYVGYAGGYFFMYDPQVEGVTLMKADEVKNPVLKSYRKTEPSMPRPVTPR